MAKKEKCNLCNKASCKGLYRFYLDSTHFILVGANCLEKLVKEAWNKKQLTIS